MKIGIITLNDFNNYGNRLQVYALQKALCNIGVEESVEMLVDRKQFQNRFTHKKSFVSKVVGKLVWINQKRKKHKYFKLNKNRRECFIGFSKKYIKMSQSVLSLEELSLCNFDYFIAGSDQIWNPYFAATPFDFLSFCADEKKISYAASFGIENIPDELLEMYKEGITSFRSLSVREATGKEMCSILGRNDVELVCDPTFLLQRGEWNEICERHKNRPNSTYVLVYILMNANSSNSMNKKLLKHAKKYAKDNNLQLVVLADPSWQDYYDASPSEFIDYVKNAELIFTNSFHCVVFSIIFHKQFWISGRTGLNSRINTLLSYFSFDDRKNFNTIKEIDYDTTDKILSELRNSGLKYLQKELNI